MAEVAGILQDPARSRRCQPHVPWAGRRTSAPSVCARPTPQRPTGRVGRV